MTEEERSRNAEAAKRRGILAFCIGCVGTAIGFMLNYQRFLKTGHLLIKRVTYGGECDLERGFGLQVFRVYPMSADPNQVSEATLSINVMSLLFAIAAITLIAFLVLGMIAKARGAANPDADTDAAEKTEVPASGQSTAERETPTAGQSKEEQGNPTAGQSAEETEIRTAGQTEDSTADTEGAEDEDGEA